MKIEIAKPGVKFEASHTMYPSTLEVFGPGFYVLGVEHQSQYGYVLEGTCSVRSERDDITAMLREGGYFALPGQVHIRIESGLLVLFTRYGYRAMCNIGKVEKKGRLSYIDGCSDSMLVQPARQGDPVLNHLHFPEDIVQTQHTHPSIRMGVVSGGRGQVWRAATGNNVGWMRPLNKGHVFLLDEQEIHSFRTDERVLGYCSDGEPTSDPPSTMDVIAFHPDSDWGPTDQNHPMLNRTYIGTLPSARGA